MKYVLKKKENKNMELEITIDNDAWQLQLTNSYNKNKGKYKVEGFRSGKAPRHMIEKIYGPTVFFDDALTDSFYDAYEEVLNKEKDFEPIDSPALSVKNIDDKGVVIVAEVAVKPEVKIGSYKNLGIKKEIKEVTDKDIDEELNKVAEKNARFLDSSSPVKKGDTVNIDFSGSIDGKKFDGGTAEGFDLVIGSKSFIDNFEDQLIGLNVGENKNIVVKFPENYHAKEFAGKEATFEVKINSIKTKELPKINDEFAGNVSEFENLEDYKKSIKENLQKQNEQNAKIDLENKIIDAIVKNIEVELPTVMIDKELDALMKDMEYKLMYQGLKLEDYANYLGKTIDELRKERTAEAEKSVKVKLAFQEIIKNEKLDVTDEDYNNKLKDLAEKSGKKIGEFKKTITDQRANYIKNEILLDKLFELLIKNN